MRVGLRRSFSPQEVCRIEEMRRPFQDILAQSATLPMRHVRSQNDQPSFGKSSLIASNPPSYAGREHLQNLRRDPQKPAIGPTGGTTSSLDA